MQDSQRKAGTERFLGADFSLLEFWQWSSSDLLGNALRGRLAEFLVAKAVGAADGVRVEWDAVDVISPAGCRIEVKSAAYLQSWQQKKPSKITFDIAPKRAWDARTNEMSVSSIRSADVYVFALLTEQRLEYISSLDLSQWRFYVISSAQLTQAVGEQKTIGLNPLEKLHPRTSDFHGLSEAIHSVYSQ